MTLILGMSKADGIYMSTDYRVTRAGRLADDRSVKFLRVLYPPLEEPFGPKALLGYTGVAVLPDGTSTGTWIRETLRGESEYFDQSMAQLRERLNRDVGSLGGLMINGLVIHGARRYFVALSNIKIDSGKPRAVKAFEYVCDELAKGFWFANGSGAPTLGADRHYELLQKQLSVYPRRTVDHLKLLATVNRRVASVDPSVSPHCHVAFIDGDDRGSPAGRTFSEGQDIPFEIPVILGGIDLTDLSRHFNEQTQAIFDGRPPVPDLETDVINEQLKRRP